MEQGNPTNSHTEKPQQAQVPQSQKQEAQILPNQAQEEEVTQQTLDHFNKICLDATQIMNEYKLQSIALKQEISGIVSVYQKSSSNATDAVPVEKIISITNEYEQGMRQANKEYQSLADELKHEEKERNEIVFQIKDCFDKLERMEQRIREKKRKEAEEKQRVEQEKKQGEKQEEEGQGKNVEGQTKPEPTA